MEQNNNTQKQKAVTIRSENNKIQSIKSVVTPIAGK